MNNGEKELFLSICLPTLPKGIGEGLKGELLFGLNNGRIKEGTLAEAFPKIYSEIKNVLKKKPMFNFFDPTNYVLEYFFKIYNPRSRKKVIPAHLVGFKAERIAGKNKLKASVLLPSGKLINAELDMSPVIRIGDVNFNAHILIHRNTICAILTETEYKELIKKYF